MKRSLVLLCFFCGMLPAPAASALEVPRLGGYVNDYAGIISAGTRSALEGELARLEQTDSTQVVILTVPSLEGEPIEEFGIRVAESWKIGQARKDNGAILIVSRDDRRVRIEVGRGLEGKLTDLMSGRVIREAITPAFRAGDYDRGFTEAVAAITRIVRGEYTATKPEPRAGRDRESPALFIALFALFWAIMVLSSKSRILGGIAGGAGLPLVSLFMLRSPGMVLLLLLALGGFAGGLLLPLLMAAGRTHGRGIGHGGWSAGGRGGWGGGFGGGFGGGGFGGGGGFSGGGGGFGGGGASGSW